MNAIKINRSFTFIAIIAKSDDSCTCTYDSNGDVRTYCRACGGRL